MAGRRIVATERARDALTLQDGARVVGALYLLGYVVECYAKAMATHRSGRPAPATHDIIAILNRAGVERSDLPPDLREFAEMRHVSLRYQLALPPSFDLVEEVRRGRALAGWCRRRLNRQARRGR